MASSEDEIYSIMFTSLKHPARRKMLRMLGDKPMTFSELVEQLGVSSSHLTYHLESLGELISKLDNGKYKLSTFGEATVSAMRGVEEAPEAETKHRLINLSFKWRTVFAVLLIGIVMSSIMASVQSFSLYQLSSEQERLRLENEQLLSWGAGTNKIATLLNDVIQIDLKKYKINLLDNIIEYIPDFDASQEILKYSLSSSESNLDARFRFRNNHFSLLQITPIESSPIYTQPRSHDLSEIARGILERYKAYSGDEYLDEMISLFNQLNSTGMIVVNNEITQGTLKLKVTYSGGNGEFLWTYTENGIDFAAKSVKMIFKNYLLIDLTDGYFLFTVANPRLDITESEAVEIAKSYVKTITNIEGQQVSGLTVKELVSVELAPHPRAGSNGLIPYWYIKLQLDRKILGTDIITIGLYADTGQVANVQMLAS